LAVDRERFVRLIRDLSPPPPPFLPPPPLPPEWEALVFPPAGPAAVSPADGSGAAVSPAAAPPAPEDGSGATAVSPAAAPPAPENGSGGAVSPAAAPPAPEDGSGGAPEDRPVRAVLFDIYGTLFCSAAGDIGAAVDAAAGGSGGIPGGEPGGIPGGKKRDRLEALAGEFAPGFSAGDLTDYFRRRVLAIHGERSGGVRYPEVRVEEIWAGFPECSPPGEGAGETLRNSPGETLRNSPGETLRNSPGETLRNSPSETLRVSPWEFALRYELAVNPVFPLPGAAETIAALRESGVLLGLVSNAQFFTPLLFDAFFGDSPEGLGFDPALIAYSFETGEAKPSPALFGRAAAELSRRGVDPGDCLYVGNDMRNDIFGAAAAGWKTVLFAGDPLSLRLRRGDPPAGDLKPWRIIRELKSLTALLSPGPPETCLPPVLCR
jgi:putative hydrolase of the HAD superfamily